MVQMPCAVSAPVQSASAPPTQTAAVEPRLLGELLARREQVP
jgi:hypothetical protein